MHMKATLSNYKQPPRKARLVADLIRGKSVAKAREVLRFLSKKSSPAFGKLLDSAVANARNAGNISEDLFVKKLTVDKGVVMRRNRPFARGRAGVVRKIRSIISIELGVAQQTANSKQQTDKNPVKRVPRSSKLEA